MKTKINIFIVVIALCVSFISCNKVFNKLGGKAIEKVAGKELVEKSSKEIVENSAKKAAEVSVKKMSKEALVKTLKRALVKSKNQFVSKETYTKWLKKGNLKKLIFGEKKDPAVLRENMRTVMGKKFAKALEDGMNQAHHIVGSDSRFPASRESQNILKKFGIDINDPMNGILLPSDKSSILKGTIHRGGHTEAYCNRVRDLLKQAKTKEQCYEALDQVKKELYSGKLQLYRDSKHQVNKIINNAA